MKEHQQLLEEERLALEVFEGFGGKSPLLFVSDFDGTLCNEFEFDPETNNHLPKLDPEIIELASERPVILATGRRTGHPALTHIRLSGLIDVETPFISENGGVVNFPHGADFIHSENLVEIETIRQIMSWGEEVSQKIKNLPEDRRFVTKPGNTMLVARIQDDTGHSTADDKERLLDEMHDIGIPNGIDVVDCGQSLTIQATEINKARALAFLLKRLGIMRDSISLVAVGNSPNDIPLFEQAELSIGVSTVVESQVDIALSRGAESTKTLLGLESEVVFFSLRALVKKRFENERRIFLHSGRSRTDMILEAYGWKI